MFATQKRCLSYYKEGPTQAEDNNTYEAHTAYSKLHLYPVDPL